ncbi:MAG: hypothetical protein A2725_02780 [Candidatus Magasanikbacteria bacterium RIFCSPHIGHO2_01_FULL_33_34]|uniref:Uncharacterized protein n=1 Tax=Candidatus Magasanikbacteria bacterium RIFCSPHIGHO2_01_FULL_33_34 TaxID=1798671 RepID=A0A1F6LGX3_9BACT|nr:MAG: hypothetical protein A2725_02780 [Candidatus Magasanikbacteria bacterium RIFCSPHIGHO2_01_FULL_33_34]OGH66060.1 MAG: hypothetical protein A3B83_00270 [Candidatus Magasanikbacteria bacterium RIFCSPHIGHO2_02_FULL_33_17]OGH75906.1 MAG: hypothetical protein A3A89_00180 [Candidatus Magasanikbacteria bacterium RIFCSPLOWO2_01_FULL_33_34]OGH81683.1 MAG: hypothetical protein A3F93_01975 [Candidatus Magasanikbacteria bacterium RIFCSPLOWO2_12_FULL_34_7]
MTLTELLQIGDEVVFKVDPERRAWTDIYNDVPDGTKGIVCGFYDAVIYESRVRVLVHQPGVYHRKGAVSVWLSDGRIVPGDWSIEMVDKDQEKRRDAALRGADGILRTPQVRLGDLPETKVWEQDKVRVRFPHDGSEHEMTIGRIDYHHMHQRRNDGSSWPFYDVRFMEGGSTSAEESWIELIERGNVWKYYNNQPLVFTDLKEEASFFHLVGQTEEVRNPKNNLYSWTEEEVLEAIMNGTVHGFSVDSGFFGSGPYINAQRFKDEELGKRVAKVTLEGFGITA